MFLILCVIGSEPSLASRNGHRSSVTASKHTLTSQENVPPLHSSQVNTHSPSDVSNQSAPNTSSLPVDANVPSLSHTSVEDSSLDTSPKTPSYVKLSCAVSGYNKYSTYGSPKEPSRIRVIKNQNGSLSSVTSDQSTGSDCDQSTSHDLHKPINGQQSCHSNGCEALVNGTDTVDSAKVTSGGTQVIANDHKSKYVANANFKPTLNGHGNSEFTLDLCDDTPTIKTDNADTPSPGKVSPFYKSRNIW